MRKKDPIPDCFRNRIFILRQTNRLIMRKTILITALLLWTAASFAQDVAPSEVPSVILNSLKEKFPKAEDVEWEIEGDLYNVEFDIGRTDHELWFDRTGKITKHEEDIRQSDLPAPIAETIKRDFGKYRVSDVKRVQSENTTVYRLELESTLEEWKVTFAADGKVLEKRED